MVSSFAIEGDSQHIVFKVFDAADEVFLPVNGQAGFDFGLLSGEAGEVGGFFQRPVEAGAGNFEVFCSPRLPR